MPRNLIKKNGVWHYQFGLRGKDYFGSCFTADPAVARQRLEARREEALRRSFGERIDHTVGDAIERWKVERFADLKANTRRRSRAAFGNLGRLLGHVRLDQLGPRQLHEYEMKRRTNVEASTVRSDLTQLSAVLATARDFWEWIDKNPVPGFLKRGRKLGLTAGEPRRRVLSVEEESRLLAAASPGDADLIALDIDSGLRRGEFATLAWEHVDTAAAEIVVPAVYSKSGKARIVFVHERGVKILERLRATALTPWVFPWRGRQRSPDSKFLNNALAKAAGRAGIDDIRVHDLRRSNATRLLRLHGWSIEEVSRHLGHSSVAVTERAYLHEGELHVRGAIKRTRDRAANHEGGAAALA